MLPRRFGESFSIAQRAPAPNDRGLVLHGAGVSGTGVVPYGTPRDAWQLARAYSHWTYVALQPICNMFAEARPEVSYIKTRPGGAASRMRQSDRRWLQSHYGRKWLQNDGDDLDPLPDSHPLIELLDRVNDGDSWQEFAIETCLMWHLTGRFYWWVVPNLLGKPFELYVIPTYWVNPVYGRDGELTHYDIRTESGGVWEFPPEEVIEGRFKSPWSKLGSVSPSQAAPDWHNTTLYIEQARKLAYQRGVNPDLVIQFVDQTPQKPDLDRIEQRLIDRAGGVHNTGRPLFIPHKAKVDRWSHAPKEMDFSESAAQNRDDILALWGANRAVCGLQQDLMRANFEGAMVAFCRMKMNPLLSLFAGILTEKLASRFDPRIRVWYRDVSPNDAAHELEEIKVDLSSGALTPNERRLQRGRDPINEPAYETAYLGAGLVPLSEAARDALPEAEPLPDDEGDKAGKSDDDDGDV